MEFTNPTSIESLRVKLMSMSNVIPQFRKFANNLQNRKNSVVKSSLNMAATPLTTIDLPRDKVKWVPLTFSLAEYRKGDLIGLFFALSSLGPMTLHTSFITLILFRRDLMTLSFFAGYLFNEPVNQVLKHILREPRPQRDRHQFGAYGMPSSHAQHIWFFTIFSSLFLIIRLPETHPVYTTGLILVLLACAGIVAYGRVYLEYHTLAQVVVGGGIGSISAILWFLMTHYVFTPWFPTIVSWSISEYFLIRDTSNVQNLVYYEYNTTKYYSKLISCLAS